MAVAPRGRMLRLEQVRAEVLERIERVDRRLAQHEQRLARIDQRTLDVSARLGMLLDALTAPDGAQGTPPEP